MAGTNIRIPATPIKPPDAAYRLEAWLGRADDPLLELAGPGEYNALLQAAQQAWALLETFLKGGLKPPETREVERRLQQLARDRYFLPLSEANVRTLLRLLREAATSVGTDGVVCACRILAAWVRRVSVQPGPTWTSKQVSAIVDSACTALASAALEGAIGSFLYVLGAAAAAPQCPPADRIRCPNEIQRALQLRRTGITHVAQFPDALAGLAYLITNVHGAPLSSLVTAMLHLWSPLPSPPSNPLLNPLPNPQPPLSQALPLSRLLEYLGAQLARLAASQDFSTRALGVADAKAVQASLASGLSTEGNPASCAAVLALAGFYQGLGFKTLADLAEQQQTLLVKAAGSASLRNRASSPEREYSHWLRCVALACARCKAEPGSPLAGHPAFTACLEAALLGDLLSLQSIHQAVAPFISSQRQGGYTRREEVRSAMSSLCKRVEGEAFGHVGLLARAFCDHVRAADDVSRTQTLQSILGSVRHLEEGHRLYAMAAPKALGLLISVERETAEGAVKKVLEASFLAVTVFCSTVFPAESADSETAVTCLEVLSRVEFCRVPFAEYGPLITRAVQLAAESRSSAEALARRMPPYAETTEFLARLEHSPCDDSPAELLGKSLEEPSALKRVSAESDDRTVEASTPGPNQCSRMQTSGSRGETIPRSTSWALDSVHVARVHFMLRVLAACVEDIGDDVFADVILPTLLLFLLHPSAAVSKSAHVLFAAFLESRQGRGQSGRNATKSMQVERLWPAEPSNGEAAKRSARLNLLQRLGLTSQQSGFRTQSSSGASVPERAALFYVERSLAGFPGLTSFEAFTGGVAAVVRHVRPGSPAIVLALRRIAYAARSLIERNVPYAAPEEEGKKEISDSKGPLDGNAGGQLTRLLVHLIPIVDIQVLTGLLSEVEGVVLAMPEQSLQQAALGELYEVLAANEDYTRKAHCTVLYQHLAEKCVQQLHARLKQGKARAHVGHVGRDKEADRAWTRMWGFARPQSQVADSENVAP